MSHQNPTPGPLARFDPAGLYRAREFEAAGIHRSQLARLVEQGEIERVARGVYRFTEGEISAEITMAAVASRAPRAIVCLLSALRYHEIGTQNPWQIWIGLDRKARPPRFSDLPVRIVRFSGAALVYGVEEIVIQGVPVRITSPARTVVDCFRYRRKYGLDIALEAIQEAIRTRRTTVSAIYGAAEALRAVAVMRPYLESLSV